MHAFLLAALREFTIRQAYCSVVNRRLNQGHTSEAYVVWSRNNKSSFVVQCCIFTTRCVRHIQLEDVHTIQKASHKTL